MKYKQGRRRKRWWAEEPWIMNNEALKERRRTSSPALISTTLKMTNVPQSQSTITSLPLLALILEARKLRDDSEMLSSHLISSYLLSTPLLCLSLSLSLPLSLGLQCGITGGLWKDTRLRGARGRGGMPGCSYGVMLLEQRVARPNLCKV